MNMIALYICLISGLLQTSISFKFFAHHANQNQFTKIYMSTVIDRPLKASTSIPVVPLKGKYIGAQEYLIRGKKTLSPLSSKLTWQNKRYADLGRKLFARYDHLNVLDKQQEKTAGRFSHVGKRLERIKSSLTSALQRQPTHTEWANAANISTNQLELYLELSAKARQRLVEHNIPAVDHWTKKILLNTKAGREVSYYELLAEGMKGLAEAAEFYDGRVPFFLYSSYYIRSKLYLGLTKLRPGSHVNHAAIMLFTKSKRVIRKLVDELQREPTDDEVARELGVKKSTYQAARLASTAHVVSADQSEETNFEDQYREYNIMNNVIKTDGAKIELEKSLLRAGFMSAMENLSATEKRMISIRFGLLDGTARTVDQTAELMCVSNEKARQILDGALHKLRVSSSDILADEFNTQPAVEYSGVGSAIQY